MKNFFTSPAGIITIILVAAAAVFIFVIGVRKRKNGNGNVNGSSLRPTCPSGIYNADGSCYTTLRRKCPEGWEDTGTMCREIGTGRERPWCLKINAAGDCIEWGDIRYTEQVYVRPTIVTPRPTGGHPGGVGAGVRS